MSEQQNQTGGMGCLKAAGIGCGVVLLLAIVAGVVFVMNFKSIATTAASAMAKAVVQDSDLPAEQKDRIVKQVNRVTQAYKAGTISDDQLGAIMEKLVNTPLMHLGMVYGFEKMHVEPSNMTADEKQAAKRSLQRFARGVFEKSIDQSEIEQVLDLVTTTDGQGSRQIKEKLTRQELDAVLAAVKAKADEAEIPDEPFEVDVATEIEKAVDEALLPPPDPDSPPPPDSPPDPAPDSAPDEAGLEQPNDGG